MTTPSARCGKPKKLYSVIQLSCIPSRSIVYDYVGDLTYLPS